jgi:hypothetical protein
MAKSKPYKSMSSTLDCNNNIDTDKKWHEINKLINEFEKVDAPDLIPIDDSQVEVERTRTLLQHATVDTTDSLSKAINQCEPIDTTALNKSFINLGEGGGKNQENIPPKSQFRGGARAPALPEWRRQAKRKNNLVDGGGGRRISVSSSNDEGRGNGLCVVQSDFFKMVFDYPTPRPHFIILFKDRQLGKAKQTLKDLSDGDLEQILYLIEEFKQIYGIAQNETAILSFHTGYWASSPHFHCHVCTSLSTYLRIFDMLKNSSVEKVKPTKNWKIIRNTSASAASHSSHQSMADLYVENVLDYKSQKLKTSREFQLKEIDQINNLNPAMLPHSPFPTNNCFNIQFDLVEPKLRFSLKIGIRLDNAKLLCIKSMCQYAFDTGLFEKKSGCHICLNVISNSKVDIGGYLHLSGDAFYKIHPFREFFLRNFHMIKNYCIDT